MAPAEPAQRSFLTADQAHALDVAATQARDTSFSLPIPASKAPPASKNQHGHHQSPHSQDRKSHNSKNGRPKKGGGGGKGTWGNILDTRAVLWADRNDPNYDSDEEPYKLIEAPITDTLEEFKRDVVTIIDEYFASEDVAEVARSIREIGVPTYYHHFIKRVVTMAMDRKDREKELAANLLSALYADVISGEQVAKGFMRLLEAADDLALDNPDTPDTLGLFLARATVDDILPPSFCAKQAKALRVQGGSVAMEAIKNCEAHLSARHSSERLLRVWGAGQAGHVDEVKNRMQELLDEYVISGDLQEACRCLRALSVPFFHHELVKKALTKAIEQPSSETLMIELLEECTREALITSNQMAKGFARVVDGIDDLELDVPKAQVRLHQIILRGEKDGWLSDAFVNRIVKDAGSVDVDGETAKFKEDAVVILKEYMASGDAIEAKRSLQELGQPDKGHCIVKRAVTLSMDRKDHEREMVSTLLSSLVPDVVIHGEMEAGFLELLRCIEDLSLDIPNAAEMLAIFVARAVVDDALPPAFVAEPGELEADSQGFEVLNLAKLLLEARHAGERLLRCWGPGASKQMADMKEGFNKLLAEYLVSGDTTEAQRCIRQLDVPFFHHELVKRSIVVAVEKKGSAIDQVSELLQTCATSGLITSSQMCTGFDRVMESLDDLRLDVPDANYTLEEIVERAVAEGWLRSTYRLPWSAAPSSS